LSGSELRFHNSRAVASRVGAEAGPIWTRIPMADRQRSSSLRMRGRMRSIWNARVDRDKRSNDHAKRCCQSPKNRS
jgi:hypothetical protein